MTATRIEYHAPSTLAQAVALLEEHGHAAAPLAGGTDLVPALKHGVLQARHLVSLARIPGHREIAITADGGLSIGAFATLADVARSPLVGAVCPALAEAAVQAGSPLLRNRGTLGGNVCLDTRCWYYNQTEAWRASRPPCQKAGGQQCYVNQKQNVCVALFSADTPAVLITVGARATLAGPAGERAVPVEALYSGEGLQPLAKSGAEILTEIAVPAPPARSGTAYLKHSPRDSIDFPLLGIAAAVALSGGGTIASARIALTGARSAPCRLPELEAALAGGPVPAAGDRELAQLATRSLGALFLTDAVPHKRRLAGLMAVDAVERAAALAQGWRTR
ncbi:MAG: FAD binding domain-containing protein [Candidatus Rokubacteria bacterium]|nr:FAD binding domain-containing protein [Candidatus Rokubacteria bacterium]